MKQIAVLLCPLVLLGEIFAQSEATFRYVDPSQLDVPWPKHSFYKQPWRAWMETVPAQKFLDGIGINLNTRTNVPEATRLLGESGFRHARIEIGWGSVAFDESSIEKNVTKQLGEKLTACKQHNIRPLILLNAHHGWPCPAQVWQATVLDAAHVGSRVVRIAHSLTPSHIIPRYTSLFRLGIKDPSHHAEDVFITAIDSKSGVCRLSRPLPVTLSAGQKVWMRRLKYQPFNEPGTPEFEETANGFVKYARIVCDFVRAQGVEFDIEIWNELTFGSYFLNIDRYYDPPIAPKGKDFLRPGGRIWETARRTIEMIKRDFPGVRCIWGFSNTTFFHTPIKELPPGTDGQSYHPYGTGFREFPAQEQYRERPGYNVDGFTPTYRAALAEGWAVTFWQTESLMRLLNPEARHTTPPGVKTFMHYMTEHGFAPSEVGVTDVGRAWQLKSKVLLRNVFFWLNKGLARFYYFCASDRDDLGMGLLPATGDLCLTPPLRALGRATKCLEGATSIPNPRRLSLTIEPLGETWYIFAGDAMHPPLTHKDVFAFLPFQITSRRFAIAVYVMTHDYTQDMPPKEYRLIIGGLNPHGIRLDCFDPITGALNTLRPEPSTDKSLSVKMSVVDYPRLLLVTEG